MLAARRPTVHLSVSSRFHRVIAVDRWVVNTPAVNYCSSKRRPFAWRETDTRGPQSLNFDPITLALCWLETCFTIYT